MTIHVKNKPIYIGIALIILGVIFNEWVVATLLSPDNRIESFKFRIIVYAIQLMLIVSGGWLLIKRHEVNPPNKAEFMLIGASTFITLFMLEIGALTWFHFFAGQEERVIYSTYGNIELKEFQYAPHHYLNHVLTPNWTNGMTSHNSLGYRGEEFTLAKPEGTFRVAVLGGSTTYTIRVEDDNKTFTVNLERLLRNEYGYENVEIINAGVGGYTSWESLINLQFRVLETEPDLVIVYHGVNDVHPRLRQTPYASDNSGYRKQWELPASKLWEQSTFLRVILRWTALSERIGLADVVTSEGIDKGLEPLDVLEAHPPVYFRRNLINMVAVAQANEVDVVLSTWAHSPRLKDYASSDHYIAGFVENNDVVREVAEEYRATLFDFAPLMDSDPKYWADGRHVNEEGALLKAQLFAAFLHEQGLIPR